MKKPLEYQRRNQCKFRVFAISLVIIPFQRVIHTDHNIHRKKNGPTAKAFPCMQNSINLLTEGTQAAREILRAHGYLFRTTILSYVLTEIYIRVGKIPGLRASHIQTRGMDTWIEPGFKSPEFLPINGPCVF